MKHAHGRKAEGFFLGTPYVICECCQAFVDVDRMKIEAQFAAHLAGVGASAKEDDRRWSVEGVVDLAANLEAARARYSDNDYPLAQQLAYPEMLPRRLNPDGELENLFRVVDQTVEMAFSRASHEDLEGHIENELNEAMLAVVKAARRG